MHHDILRESFLKCCHGNVYLCILRHQFILWLCWTCVVILHTSCCEILKMFSKKALKWLKLNEFWSFWCTFDGAMSIIYRRWLCDQWSPLGHTSLSLKISVVSRCLPRAKLYVPRIEQCEHRCTYWTLVHLPKFVLACLFKFCVHGTVCPPHDF